MKEEILKRIPQRDPFLYLTSIIDQTDTSITTSYEVTGDEDFFKGHFPGNPIMPGVILCEAAFQSGALLMSYINDDELASKTAVVTRIKNAKFKKLVKPGETLELHTTLDEKIDGTAFIKTKITSSGKTALQIHFACTLIGE